METITASDILQSLTALNVQLPCLDFDKFQVLFPPVTFGGMTDSPGSVSSKQTVNMTHSSQNEISGISIKVSGYCDIQWTTTKKEATGFFRPF